MKDQVTSIGQPLRLVDGKFLRGDVEVKPEIGNPEQIALLQKINFNDRYGLTQAVIEGRKTM